MSAHPLPRLSPEQYLAIERAAEIRSEYFDGQMYAMSGAAAAHVLITCNLAAELRQALRKRCLVFPLDLRVRIAESGLYTYPDVSVVCEQPRYADDQRDTLLNPSVIFEVLSRSTEAHDRGFKFAQYRTLESLREYFLVSQYEPRIELFERHKNGQWIMTEYAGLGAACEIESAGCRISLSDIYENVSFETA